MNCEEAKLEIYTKYIDKQCDDETIAKLNEHLEKCSECKKELAWAEKIKKFEYNVFLQPQEYKKKLISSFKKLLFMTVLITFIYLTLSSSQTKILNEKIQEQNHQFNLFKNSLERKIGEQSKQISFLNEEQKKQSLINEFIFPIIKPRLVSILKDQEDKKRYTTAYLLGELLKDRKDVQDIKNILVDILNNDLDSKLQCYVAYTFGNIADSKGDSDIFNALTYASNNNTSEDVRRYSKEALHKIDTYRKAEITILTGKVGGVYYQNGLIIKDLLETQGHLVCDIKSSEGSISNLNTLISHQNQNRTILALVQSDSLYEKYMTQYTLHENIKVICALHTELFTLIAENNIDNIQKLKGKDVYLGSHGSGTRKNAIDALLNANIDCETEIKEPAYIIMDAPELLKSGDINALFYTIGHPSQIIRGIFDDDQRFRFVSIEGLEKLINKPPTYYQEGYIPVKYYYGNENQPDIKTLGMKALLVTNSNEEINPQIIEQVTKTIFENFSYLQEKINLTKQYDMIEHIGIKNVKQITMENLIHPNAKKYYINVAGLQKLFSNP